MSNKKKLLIFIAILCMIAVVGLLLKRAVQHSEKTIDAVVASAYKSYPVKAVIYSVWKEGRLISSGALGQSMTGVPANTEMHFRIGGVTETFLTTLLMIYVDQKKVSLDDKVAKWFPDYPHANEITLKMLANCTSGYADYVYAKGFEKALYADVFKQWTSAELLQFAFKKPLEFKPGSQQHYSHTNYVILGDILEKVGGERLAVLLENMILRPLDLDETAYQTTAQMPMPILHAFSNERGVYEDATFWSPSWTSSTGMMTSTIDDLAKWAQLFGEGQLLERSSYQQLISKENASLGKNAVTRYFAMGFGVVNGWFIQNPNFNGYSGVFAYHPNKKITIVIFNTLKNGKKLPQNYSMMAFEKISKIIVARE